MEIHLDGIMPEEVAIEFMKMIREFDHNHEDCHFDITTHDDTQTVEQARAMMKAAFPPREDRETRIREFKKSEA